MIAPLTARQPARKKNAGPADAGPAPV